MQQSFKKIQQFTTSPHSIFTLSPIDYPNQFQQSLFSSYITLLRILQKPHQQILRQLNNQSQKNYQQISQGFLYLFLLDKKNIDKYSQYTVILRIQIWNYIAYYLEIMYAEYGDVLRVGLRRNGVGVYGLIGGLGIWGAYMAVLISNWVNVYEGAAEAKEFVREILVFWVGRIQEGVEFQGEMVTVICHYILPKAIKVCPYICQKQCLKLISLITQKYPQQISKISEQLIYILQSPQTLKIPQLLSLLTNLSTPSISPQLPSSSSSSTPASSSSSTPPSSSASAPPSSSASAPHLQQIIFSYLPRKLQIILQYIFKQNIRENQLMYHLIWLQKNWQSRKVNYGEILVQLGRWASISNNAMDIKITILEWVCKKCINISAELFDRVKRAIFYPWFLNLNTSSSSFSLDQSLPSLILLRQLLSSDIRICLQLLKHLLKYRNNQPYQQRISHIFTQAIKTNHFRIQFIVQNRLIPVSYQQQFINLLRQPRTKIGQDLKYDPEVQVSRMEGKMDQEYIDYLRYQNSGGDVMEEASQMGMSGMGGSGTAGVTVNVNPFSMVEIESQQIAEIVLEQQYIDQFSTIQNIMDNPTYQSFIQYFKQFSKIGLQISTKNKQFLPTLLHQTCKLIYCLYNTQFQSPSSCPPSQSIILYIITTLMKQWHQVTHRIILIKNLVKKMFQLFPTAEVAFWYCFFMYVDTGVVNYRDFKAWIVGMKGEVVVRAVEVVVGAVEGFKKKYYRSALGK